MRWWIGLGVLLGCGGKIVETTPLGEPTPPGATTPVEMPSAAPPPAPSGHPAPTSVTPLDACEVLCERDARCDTTLPALPVIDGASDGDCKARCEKRLAGKCGIDDWLLCYASAIDPKTCTPLPDECKPAFCAWATCSRQPVSNCE